MFNRKFRKSTDPKSLDLVTSPIYPLPALNGRQPVIVTFDTNDIGVDLTYERTPLIDAPYVRRLVGDPTQFFMPSLIPVIAASSGLIAHAGKHADGYAIVIDHENGWMSLYGKLDHYVTPAKTVVRGGDIIGYVGSPSPGPLRTLRFELWKREKEKGLVPVDPIRFMRSWLVLPWHDRRFDPKPPRASA